MESKRNGPDPDARGLGAESSPTSMPDGTALLQSISGSTLYCNAALPNSRFVATLDSPQKLYPLLSSKAALPGGNSLSDVQSRLVWWPTSDKAESLLVPVNWSGSGGSSKLSSPMVSDVGISGRKSEFSKFGVELLGLLLCVPCSSRRKLPTSILHRHHHSISEAPAVSNRSQTQTQNV